MNQNNLCPFIANLNICIFIFFLLYEQSLCLDQYYEACVPKNCGDGRNISYPFYIQGQQQPFCGYPGFELRCSNSSGHSLLHIPENDFIVQHIYYTNRSLRLLYNAAVLNPTTSCFPQIRNTSLDIARFEFGNNVSELVLLSNCSEKLPEKLMRYKVGCNNSSVDGGDWSLAILGNDTNLRSGMGVCGAEVVAPVELFGDDGKNGIEGNYEELLRRGFVLKWFAGDCSLCEESGGRCGFNMTSYHFMCYCPDGPHVWRCRTRKRNIKLILLIAIPGSLFILVLSLVIFIILRHCHKWSNFSSHFLRKNTSRDLEDGSVYFGVPVFSYTKLEEATNNFDPAKELGDGGFGTVYHGKLQDGREVAVKRLYEHNYKRVEQFMNEVEILTRLRHRNLVLLYGCTSHRSRELLLVYEYIPNGTVADHLHGDRANPSSLTWPIRMNIAMETASALAYLHASDIVHRDVKTNNILLDDNFCVKVADFGLSRLLPNDVSHVSTAPQGTPGYVDPEYHQCYQLTDKSDVYSFGVVLIELISSMPAIDISRHRHEINLANLAINRIQRSAFNELINPNLGIESDSTAERMATSVAELAFRCLQYDKEMRPTMNEVLEVLKEIHSEETNEANDSVGELKNGKLPPSPETEDVVLLKNDFPSSPISVTDKWLSSCSTTPNTSG